MRESRTSITREEIAQIADTRADKAESRHTMKQSKVAELCREQARQIRANDRLFTRRVGDRV
jgi:hypothetical protein